MLLVFIALYLIATLLIGWWASKRVRSAADFAVAGKRLPTFMVACALFATWFGSETVMGASSEFIGDKGGILAVIEDPFGASLCLLLAGLLIARPLYRLNLLTFSDYFRLRFNRSAEVVSALVMAPSYFSWITAQLVALATVLQAVSGLERDWGVVICTLLVLFYTYIGGMWAVAITDFVQTLIIIAGMAALAVDLTMQAGGIGPLVDTAPEGFFRFFPEADSGAAMGWLAAWMTIGLGGLPQQDIFQRIMAGKSLQTAVRACYISSGMYFSIALLPLLIAYCGKYLYPELAQGDLQMLLPSVVMQHTSLGMQVLFFGALLSAILSTASGAMLAPATVIGENLIKPFFRKITDAQLLRLMRFAVVLVALVTGGMALARDNIYELVGESSAFSLVALFIPLMGGIYWKKTSPFGAMAGMLAGLAGWLLAQWTEPWRGGIWLEIPAVFYGLAANILALVMGSFLRPENRVEDLEGGEQRV
ncbi:MAG: sodium:solute symporter family protein [Saprospiraceae bacterium]|nr:sodium:solute symporter family protein [Saprospiraceae bacterium]